MNKQHLITIVSILAVILLAFFIYKNSISKSIINKTDTVIKTGSKFILCGKDYSNFENTGYTIDKKYKLSDNYALYYFKIVDSLLKIARLDGCTGQLSHLVGDYLNTDGSIFSNNLNNSVYIFKNKYVIYLANGYPEKYTKLYIHDLSKDIINNEPGMEKFRIIDLNLADNETLLHYQYSCGEGCDSETRIFSATTTENSIILDIFDNNKKYDLKIPIGITVKANTKLRTITIDTAALDAAKIEK